MEESSLESVGIESLTKGKSYASTKKPLPEMRLSCMLLRPSRAPRTQVKGRGYWVSSPGGLSASSPSPEWRQLTMARW